MRTYCIWYLLEHSLKLFSIVKISLKKFKVILQKKAVNKEKKNKKTWEISKTTTKQSNYLNNKIKCEWINQLNQKEEISRLVNKTRFNYILSTRDTLYLIIQMDQK